MALQIPIEEELFIVPQQDDPCSMWISYYQKLQDLIGTDYARYAWLMTWEASGNPICATNPSFDAFVKKNGIDITNAATRTIAGVNRIGGNVLGTVGNMSFLIKYAFPVLAGGILLTLLAILFNSGRDMNIMDVASMHPAIGGTRAALGGQTLALTQ